MTVAGKIDIRTSKPVKEGDLLLGEDWESPEAGVDPTISEGRARRGLISLNRSPLARKIIVFNLLALTVLVAGVLFLKPVPRQFGRPARTRLGDRGAVGRQCGQRASNG